MALHRPGPVLFSTNPEDQINFLKSKGLLRTQQDCPACGIAMEWKRRPSCGDKFTWQCPSCNSRKLIRNESFISKSKLTLLLVVLQYQFVIIVPVLVLEPFLLLVLVQ